MQSSNAAAKLLLAEFKLRQRNRPELTALANRLKVAREDVEPNKIEKKAPIEEAEKDTQTLIKEHGDLLITVFKSLPANSDVRKRSRQLFDNVKSLQNALRDVGKGLIDALGGSDEELKDLDESSMGELHAALEQESKELGTLLKISQLIKTYERKAVKDGATKPVKHKLPRKDKKEKEKAQIKPQDKDKKKQKPDRELKKLLEDME